MVPRVGRRPGKQDTRETILVAARDAFAEQGYDGASIRLIAARAYVDPALVHHYFGTKAQLFRAAVRAPIDPEALLPQIFAEGPDRVPENLVRTFVHVWEGPVTGPAMRSLLRSAVAHRRTGRLLREFFTTQVIRRAAAHLDELVDPSEIPLRASLVAGQLFGLALTRYVLEFEPLASAPSDTVVAAVAPSVRRYLFEPLS